MNTLRHFPATLHATSKQRYRSILLNVSIAWLGACGAPDSVTSPRQRPIEELTPSTEFPGTVSNPVVSPAVSHATGSAGIADAQVVYVSLGPGGIPEGNRATIVNRRTQSTVSTVMVAGGFDPVAIDARDADTLHIAIRMLGGETRATWIIVARTKRPIIVRTDPPPKKRDVPLNAKLRVVFSEPIDASSVTGATVTLDSNGGPTDGQVEVPPGEPWIVQFTPNEPLAPGATYELKVSTQVRDLNGETLESPALVEFTTALAPDPMPQAGRIAFSTWTGSDIAIFTMNPDGSGLAWLTYGQDPSFSPDGTKIAFWRYVSSPIGVRVPHVLVMNADGSAFTEVVSPGYQPTWSPDGSRLAYGCGGICVVNLDGTGRQVITDPERPSYASDICIRDTDPAWSPDGSAIAFTRWPDSRIPVSGCLPLSLAQAFPFDFWTAVFFVAPDGTNLRALRDDAGQPVTYAGWPAWSPDGKRLAFYYVNGGEERIDVANADGSGIITAVRQSPPNWSNVLGSPAWSPDGTQLLFSQGVNWGFADASGSGNVIIVPAPVSPPPYSLSWSWSRK